MESITGKLFVWHIATGGMIHMLNLISSSLIFCKENKRKLIIESKTHRAFCLDFFEAFDVLSPEYFCDEDEKSMAIRNWTPFSDSLPKSITELRVDFADGIGYLAGLKALNGDSYYLQKFIHEHDVLVTIGHLHNLTRQILDDRLTFIFSQIRLKQIFTQSARKLYSELPKYYIGVHYRNTDYKNDLKLILSNIKNEAKNTGIYNVFIATDDIKAKILFEKNLVGFNVYFNNNVKLEVSSGGLHYATIQQLALVGQTKKNQHEEFWADLFV